jgi:hypothetical protein
VVFWNVYGMEPLGLRSHFIPDWLDHCLLHNNTVSSMSDGHESRQLISTQVLSSVCLSSVFCLPVCLSAYPLSPGCLP